MYDIDSKLIKKARKHFLNASDTLVKVNQRCWGSSDDVADDFVHPEVLNELRAIVFACNQTLMELECASHDYV